MIEFGGTMIEPRFGGTMIEVGGTMIDFMSVSWVGVRESRKPDALNPSGSLGNRKEFPDRARVNIIF